MKQIKAILLSLMIIINLIISVSAVDWYDEAHQAFVPTSNYPSFYSPFRTTATVNQWNGISSTHNEPRNGAGITHYAIDVYGYRGSLVYPIANGYVEQVGGSDATRYVIIRHPLPTSQGGGSVYVRYMHLKDIPSFTTNQYINYTESIGKTIDFTYPDHVDMVLYRWTNTNLPWAGNGVSRTWIDYYGDISTWSYGNDLEYIKNVTFTKVSSQYKVSATIYTFSSVNVKKYPSSVTLYVKKSGVWSSYSMTGSSGLYEYTLPSALTGNTIEYYIVAQKTGEGWGLYPSYYYNPPSDNSTKYDTTNPQYTFSKYLS